MLRDVEYQEWKAGWDKSWKEEFELLTDEEKAEILSNPDAEREFIKQIAHDFSKEDFDKLLEEDIKRYI